MSGGRPKRGPLACLMGSPLEEQQAAKPRANRLSRSSRQRLGSEQDSPRSQRAEFKTPTRIPRFRPAGSVCGESLHNDSDFQQDIIWDATSPSPNRRGKRGKMRPAGDVSISEIVSRIAPKHGRPEDADPTLQQWIGDSAAIPCTPDVQPPKPKKKSPRPNAVDHLLKLAKQFDFNMFCQDEEAEDMHQQSLEVLSEDILEFKNGIESEVSPSLPASCLPAVSAMAGTGVQLLPHQRVDGDLDFLFDGPTQYVSGNLSQASSAQSQGKPPREASGKPSDLSHGPTSSVSTPHCNGTSASTNFEDDWGDDNLLNDSLVLEMTQNPLKFASPKLCSTQKPAGQVRYQRESPAAAGVAVGLGQSAAPKAEKENIRPRATFLLEPNPAFSVERIQNAHRQVGYSSNPAGRDAEQSGSSAQAGSRRPRQTCQSNSVKPDLQKPPYSQKRTSAEICQTAASQTTNAPNFPQRAGVSSHSELPADADFLDDDLDAFFLSDPVWDDPADDELLCEMCEDLENQLQGVAEKQASLNGQIPNQSAALQPTSRTGRDNRTWQLATAPPTGTGTAAGNSLAGGSASSVTVKVNETPPPQHATKDQFTFKRPTDPVSTATNNVRGKCSAAEIERKKQQAMERRRRRLQATQNLRNLT